MGNFQELKVWKLGVRLAKDIYAILNKNSSLKKDYRFVSQITACAVSIPSNIAEGDELKSTKQGINHFYISKGSCAELITQLIIAKEIGYIANENADALINQAKQISASLYKLIEARKSWD